MKRIYANPAFARRMNISAAVVAFAFIFGLWELWAALRPGSEGGSYGLLFAALFIGGSVYAMRQMLTDYADIVTALDADRPANRTAISVWRPFGPKRIEGDLDRLGNWRFETQKPRGDARIATILADHPGHPRPLRFEVGRGLPISDDLRALAPDAVAAYERAAGRG